MRKQLLGIGMAFVLSFSSSIAFAEESANVTTMENCGAYLFQWRPVDCGNGRYFTILAGGNTIAENNVILSRGYDYAYTFDPSYGRPWGQAPALVNVDGVWAIPENQTSLPEGTQPALRITLVTNNKILPTRERYIDVVSLPAGVRASELPPEVRKYLINVDGSDAGAYEGTVTAGWDEKDGLFRYRKPDGAYFTNGWIKVDGVEYYMNEEGVMLTDTITPDGIYVNAKGERTTYIPGWAEVNGEKRYIMKNGYYASNGWQKDTDGKYYYFNMAYKMLVNTRTPDGYYVGEDGAWDGNPSTDSTVNVNLGPGAGTVNTDVSAEGWEADGEYWKYKLSDGNYVTNGWKQTNDGKWYYFDATSRMMTSVTTPDGYYVDADGVWDQQEKATQL